MLGELSDRLVIVGFADVSWNFGLTRPKMLSDSNMPPPPRSIASRDFGVRTLVIASANRPSRVPGASNRFRKPICSGTLLSYVVWQLVPAGVRKLIASLNGRI